METEPSMIWTKVTTDSEFGRATKMPGLHLVELYNSDYGVCVPMQNPLREFKLQELPEEPFFLVQAEVDDIRFLKRFRRTSEPVWMLIGSGTLITIMFGVNPLILFAKIKEELQTEMKVLAGEVTRPQKSYCKTPEEEQHQEWLESMTQLHERETEQEKFIRAEKYRLKSSKLEEYLKDKTLVLFFSNGRVDPTGDSIDYPALTMLQQHYVDLQVAVDRHEGVQLDDEKMRKIFCQSSFVIPEQLRESLASCVALVLKYMPHSPYEALAEMEALLDEGEMETRVASLVYGIQDNGRIDVNKPRLSSIMGKTYTPYYYIPKSSVTSNSTSLKKPTKATKSVQIELPTLWTPENVAAKCSAMFALYGDQLRTEFKLKIVDPPPPMTMIVFEAPRSGGIERMLKGKPAKLYKYAYFTAGHPSESPKLVARNWTYMKRFDKTKMAATRMVVGLLEFNEHKIAEYLLTDPLYVTDPETGSLWAETFFPPAFADWKEEIPMELLSLNSGMDENEDGNASNIMFDEMA